LYGESGTGKEVAARLLHESGERREEPFIAVNCAALTETLLESELFGHEKGAFTGAVADKKGLFEVADRGTIFLDEVGELAPTLQAKLLRVLQEREVTRVGSTRPRKVDVRVIAATNRELAAMVSKGTFRPDLYHRLNVVAITLPPLRERREDIPLLAQHLLERLTTSVHREIQGISPSAMDLLTTYDWPGNVRELQNVMERAVVLGSADTIQPEDLPEQLLERTGFTTLPEYHLTLINTKKKLINSALERSQGSYTGAADLLGIHPNYLHRLIRNLGIKKPVTP
jgi:transcriptional regulator with PAS, ATPase and Fis domain